MEGKLVFVTLVLVGICNGHFVRLNDEQRLAKMLLSVSRRGGINARPITNVSDALPVTFGISLIKVQNIKEHDDNQATIKMQTWHRYTWKNDQLRWDPADFGGLTTARLPVDKMWMPDIKMYNGLDVNPLEDRDTLSVVSSDGTVLWIPPAIERVHCSKDEERNQWVCQLKYGSWTYDALKLSLNFFRDLEAFNVDHFRSSSTLELVENSAQRNSVYYPCCAEPYIDLTFTLRLSPK